MKTITALQATGLSLFSLALFPATSFAAIETFDPYVFAGVVYDSNVFKTQADEEDDTTAHIGAGFDLDWKVSRQHILLNGLVDRAQYDNFDELDHTRADAGAAWKWQVGNLWSGDLKYRYRHELASFEEFTTRIKDLKSTHRVDFVAGYQIHPDLELLAGLGGSDTSFDEREQLDRETRSKLLELRYSNTRRTRVGIRGRITDTNLKEDTVINGVDVSNDYEEDEISGVFYWEGSGKSSVEARLGYTDLRYDERDERDFQGTTGRLTHFWRVTGKTRVDTSIWRETDSRFDEITTYVLSKGVSVKPIWDATAKIRVTAEVSFINNDYKGEDVVTVGDRRDDDIWLYALGVRYSPTRNLGLLLGYRNAERDSSEGFADYEAEMVNAQVRFKF